MGTLRPPAFVAIALVLCAAAWHRASAQAPDIVLWSSDVSLMSGLWTRAPSTTGAGGLKMTTPDTGWSAAAAPLAAPSHFFEVAFDAQANTTYQVWLRLRAAADSKWNDSVWLQFDAAVDAAGGPLWRIGSTSALLVNLEDCVGCGVSGWGWQDNASWTGQQARIRFAESGRRTLRVQLREDGVDVDQIVLSPSTWLSSAPGRVRDDTTIAPKTGAGALTFVRHPYLQQLTASSVVVAWATREAGSAEVRYGRAGGATGAASGQSRRVTAAETGMGFDYHQHETLLTDLSPATSYTYRVAVAGVEAPAGHAFTTAPATGAGTVRFIAFGDSGIGSTEQRRLASLMTADAFDFALHTGDVAYGVSSGVGAGGYPQLHSWFFDIYQGWLPSRPMFPSIGNHDDEAGRAAPFRDLFVLPANGGSARYPDHAERYYSFDYGPAHVVVLDTELAFQDVQRRQEQVAWLADDLARTTQPWKIAAFHRPPFSAGSHHGSDLAVRNALSPIFEAHGVSLVLSGHEHDYERSVPWRVTPDGQPVTYIVTGGGGGPLYPAGVGPWTAASRAVHHYVRGTVSPCSIALEGVGLDGAVFDSARLERCGPPPPEVVLYAADVATVAGAWSRVADSTAAGGLKLATPDLGRPVVDTPPASPTDYVEATFDAPAGVPYRLWLRLRATGDTKWNDSVWVQLSDAVGAGGGAIYRIGSASGLLVNLENCYACGVSGWGWQNRGYWLADTGELRFATAGPHTIRIMVREDGVQLDQIVLSPARFLSAPPGALRQDTVIVPKP